ncbi:MAG TPA: ferritin-like domain-containing protein [Thermoleophilaceae bacterium]
MFDKIENPKELFGYKLGAAYTMEQNVLGMLDDLQQETTNDQLRQLFSHHADETRQQIGNIEQAFAALGEEADDKPCPAIQGLEKESKAEIKMAEDSVVDAVILSGAAETEHHEIAVYESLITQAEAMGNQQVAQLLKQNLEQEQHTLEEVKGESQRLAQTMAGSTA